MKRIWKALWYSIDGIIVTWRDEAAFREEIILAIFLIPLAVFIAPDALSLLLMIGSVMLVLIIELINTAIEATVNRIGVHRDNLAKKAKDTASAAVLMGLINVVIVWTVILIW
jgi:diacylglycerol kinase (ATP)